MHEEVLLVLYCQLQSSSFEVSLLIYCLKYGWTKDILYCRLCNYTWCVTIKQFQQGSSFSTVGTTNWRHYLPLFKNSLVVCVLKEGLDVLPSKQNQKTLFAMSWWHSCQSVTKKIANSRRHQSSDFGVLKKGFCDKNGTSASWCVLGPLFSLSLSYLSPPRSFPHVSACLGHFQMSVNCLLHVSNYSVPDTQSFAWRRVFSPLPT